LTDDDLTREMNKLNLFSPASHHVMIKGVNYNLRDMYRREKIISVGERRENVWSV
jgi:hypothetical protein